MTTESWERYALAIELARRLGSTGRLGKKAFQKLVYLLQELEGIPTGYSFRFFTYGPFSDDLAYTLDVIESMGGLQVVYDPKMNGYQISPGEKADNIAMRGRIFLDRHRAKLDRLIERFGGRTAKELELIATVVYLSNAHEGIEDEALVEGVIELKPKYDRRGVARSIDELRKLNYLE